MVAFRLKKNFDTHWRGEDDSRRTSYLRNAQKAIKCRQGVKGWLTAKLGYTIIAGHQSAHGGLEWLPLGSKIILSHIDLGKMISDPRRSFQTVWLNKECRYLKNGGVGSIKSEMLIQNLFAHSSFLGILDRAKSISPCFEDGNVDPANTRDVNSKHVFPLYHSTLFSLGKWDQATLKSPGFEGGNLDRPKPGILVPNMSCTFVQIPHHDLVPFSALQINGLFFWSVGIYLYHKKAHRKVPILDPSILRVSNYQAFWYRQI